MKKIKNKIAITGMSMLSPFGFGIEVFEQALKNGHCAIRNIEDTHPEESKILPVAAYLPNIDFSSILQTFNTNNELKNKYISLAARAPKTVQASLLVALKSYINSNLATQDPTKIGIIVTGNNTNQKQNYVQQRIFTQDPTRVSPRHALNFFDSSHIGYVSELLNITGEGHVIGAASASGNMALIQAARLLELQVVDQCIVIGVFADLSVVELQAFRHAGALGGIKFKYAPKQSCRPFDREHEGFIPGQISACLILEREAVAKKRHTAIMGYISGYGIALDAQHSTEVHLEGELRAISSALSSSGLTISTIDYINTHGTSSVLGDQTESAALLQLLNTHTKQPFINSTKSITGHCLFSAGIVEAIASLIQLQKGFLHANLNLENSIEDNLPWVRSTSHGNFTHALSNNFAFGGINTSIILTKGESPCV